MQTPQADDAEVPAADRLPPTGQEADPPVEPAADHQCLDWCPICRGADILRATVTPELQDQFNAVQRDALLMAQALIEAQLERMRSPRAGGPGAARSDEDSAPATDRPATAADGDPDVESIPIE